MKQKCVGWSKGIVHWLVGNQLYMSIPFTWNMADARKIADPHKGPVVVGGPAVALLGKPIWADEAPALCLYNTLAMHNPLATFTSRGCPNRCRFCAVPKTEGAFRELPSWRSAPIVCDNNLLASSRAHFQRVIDSLVALPYVDFNQGLDARRFTSWHLDQICRLKKPIVRFAFDHVDVEGKVADAITACKSRGISPQCYVLIGYEDSPADAKYRLEKIRSFGLLPNPMRYQPLDATKKNAYVAPGWTQRELLDYMRFYAMLGHWRTKTLEEYVETGGFGNRKLVQEKS